MSLQKKAQKRIEKKILSITKAAKTLEKSSYFWYK
jgi:hypothetical protein